MPNLPPIVNFPAPDGDADAQMQEVLQRFFQQLVDLLNSGLRVDDNFDAKVSTLTTPAVADTEFNITHELKRTPTGFWVVHRDKAGIVYVGSTAWSNTTVYFKSNVASMLITLVVF